MATPARDRPLGGGRGADAAEGLTLGPLDDLQRLGLTVGRVVAVGEHAGARAPAYLVTVDLGPQGRHEASVPRGDYGPDELVGAQVVCVRDRDDLHVLAAHSHAHGLVLVRPDRDVEEGSVVA